MSDLAMLNVLVLVGLCVSLSVIAYITRSCLKNNTGGGARGTGLKPGRRSIR